MLYVIAFALTKKQNADMKNTVYIFLYKIHVCVSFFKVSALTFTAQNLVHVEYQSSNLKGKMTC